MGLDVYLKKCANREEADRLEQKYETQTDALWEGTGEYSSISEEKKENIRSAGKAIAAELGLDEDGAYPGREDIRIPSKIDPDHLFKVGYFRSSYNDAGLDSVLSTLSLPGLAEIMSITSEDYNVTPDWESASARIDNVIAKYAEHLESDAGKFSVLEVRPMFEYGVADKKSALDLFIAKSKDRSIEPDWRSFSTSEGQFFLDGVTVHAFITKKLPGRSSNPLENFMNTPSLFAICAKPKSNKPDWHLTALQIVKETIEYVIAQPDRANYYMSWSG